MVGFSVRRTTREHQECEGFGENDAGLTILSAPENFAWQTDIIACWEVSRNIAIPGSGLLLALAMVTLAFCLFATASLIVFGQCDPALWAVVAIIVDAECLPATSNKDSSGEDMAKQILGQP